MDKCIKKTTFGQLRPRALSGNQADKVLVITIRLLYVVLTFYKKSEPWGE